MMNGSEKSDPAIVARKPTNKADQSAAEDLAAYRPPPRTRPILKLDWVILT